MLLNSQYQYTFLAKDFVPHASAMSGPLMFPESLILSVDIDPVLFIGNQSQIVRLCMIKAHSLHVAQSVTGTLASEKRRDIGVVPRRVAALLIGAIAAINMSSHCSWWDFVELTCQATTRGLSNCCLGQWKAV